MQFKSLATRTLLQMALRISCVILIGSLASYVHQAYRSEKLMKDNFVRYMAERGEREKSVFSNAEQNHRILAAEFLKLYQKYKMDPNTPKRFDLLAERKKDGAFRNRDPHFDGKTQTGVFIAKDQPVSIDFQARILASHEVTQRMGIAYHGAFQDTYFTFPENAIVLYWPEFPNWVIDNKANSNLLKEEYHAVTTPENNPSHKTAWTGLFYDEVSKIWMVTGGTPIFDGDRYIGSIHHDMMVNEILDRTIENRMVDADGYYIFRGDGRLILHPGYQKSIEQKNGLFSIYDSNDKKLISQFQLLKSLKGKSDVFESEDQKEYLAVAKIEGPDWYLVTSYPKKVADAQARSGLIFMLIAGFISLLIEVLVLYSVLKKQISQPLVRLIEASNEIAYGQFNKPIDLNRADELGALATSFNHMAKSIQERDQKLEVHAHDLERLVDERTKELDEQKLINLQASKMSALGEMAGGIAHEINTPLATIQLLTSQLHHEITNDIPDLDNLATQVQKIENTADRVAKIVKGLKTFARDGSSDPFTPTSAQSIIHETIELCTEQMRRHNVQLKLNIPETPIMVECRSVQISQVLLNLISNAKDAIENLPERWIEVTIRETNEWVEFRVTDNGTGVSKELQEKIFQPFFTTKGIGKGTGMGLSISLGIIKAHHGQLTIDAKSQNTCFVVRLRHKQALAA